MKIRDADYKFTMYRICDGVFQRGKMHKLSTDLKMEMFERYDIYNVVGLAPSYSDPGLQELDKSQFINYYFLPISDGKLHDNVTDKLLQLAKRLARKVEAGRGVLCHCNAGRNRSGLLNALIVMELLQCSGEQAMEIVREQRPRAIDNLHFEEFLRGLK